MKDLKTFIKRFSIKLLILSAFAFACFFIPHNGSYYLDITNGSSYKKISWIYHKIRTSSIDSGTVLFTGPSLCLNGIDDSLMTAIGSRHYLNIGINHSCNGLTFAELKDILETRKPAKVYLGLRYGNSSGIHNMYPIVVSATEILRSATYMNTWLLSCIYKKAAWNINFYTRFYKLRPKGNSATVSPWGQEVDTVVNVEKVKRLYEDNYSGFKKIFDYQAGEDYNRHGLKGNLKTFYRYALEQKSLYADNVLYQLNMLKACKDLLVEKNIDYDFVLFPDIHQQIAGNTAVTARFYENTYPQIFGGHKIIFEESPELGSFEMWTDHLHLNKQGAAVFSKLLLRDIE